MVGKSKKAKLKKQPKTYGAIGVEVIFGHQHCTPKGKFFRVPRGMGWLWTSKDVPGLKFRPDWRPGAIRRSVVKLIKRAKVTFENPSEESKLKAKSIYRSPKNSKRGRPNEADEDDEEDEIQPTFVIKKVDGNYVVTLQELKNIKNRSVLDFPYSDQAPYNFQVLNRTPEEMKKLRAKKEKVKQCTETLLFQEAFSNICKEIYQSIDKCALSKLARQKEICMCQALQSEVLNSFAGAIADISPEEYCHASAKPSKKSLQEEEDWVIEFTPPCAKYDPNRKMKNGRTNKFTQFEKKEIPDEEEDALKKKGRESGKGIWAQNGGGTWNYDETDKDKYDEGCFQNADAICTYLQDEKGDSDGDKKKKNSKKRKKEKKQGKYDKGNQGGKGRHKGGTNFGSGKGGGTGPSVGGGVGRGVCGRGASEKDSGESSFENGGQPKVCFLNPCLFRVYSQTPCPPKPCHQNSLSSFKPCYPYSTRRCNYNDSCNFIPGSN